MFCSFDLILYHDHAQVAEYNNLEEFYPDTTLSISEYAWDIFQSDDFFTSAHLVANEPTGERFFVDVWDKGLKHQ